MKLQFLANGTPNCCVHFSFLLGGNGLNSSERDRERKRKSDRDSDSQMRLLFFSFASVTPAETLCKKCSLRLALCSFNIETLPPSLIWCFQICPFTRAYTKAFIISLYPPLSLSPSRTHCSDTHLKYADWRDSWNLQMHHPTALSERHKVVWSGADDSLEINGRKTFQERKKKQKNVRQSHET